MTRPGASRRGRTGVCRLRYELSQRIATRATEEELLTALQLQLHRVARDVNRHNKEVIARKIEQTIGSPFRATRAAVSVRPAEDGWLVVADVTYTPTFTFAMALLCGLFTFVLWLIPIVFYVAQQGSVRSAVERVLARVRDEYESRSSAPTLTAPPPQVSPGLGVIAELEALGRLKAEGILTPEEFTAQKQKLLAPPAS